jgi:predicted house-cleaning NTP pyrophosphatase (Maf/HAM1 superfamily)
MRVVLGTSSRWRRQLWRQHFDELECEFEAPDIDEKAIRHADAEALTLLIANAKADALVERR